MYSRNLAKPSSGHFSRTSFSWYRALNAISTSEINRLQNTLAHWRVSLEASETVSDSLKIGNAFDALIESERRFREEIGVLAADVNLRTKVGQATRDGLQKTFGANAVLKEVEARVVRKMVDAAKANKRVAEMIKNALSWQGVIVWESEGIPRRCRYDLLTEIGGKTILVDFKTTALDKASPRYNPKHFYDFGYHRQAAAYLEAARTVELGVDEFWFVFVESSAPYAVRAEPIDEVSLKIGELELEERLKKILYAIMHDDFPAYPSGDPFTVPRWVKERQLEGLELGNTKKNVERAKAAQDSANDLLEEIG